MQYFVNFRTLLLAAMLSITGLNTWANSYNYHAEVKGMVCAFCAYSVSKNISQLAGVDADSVNVDLKAGEVTFSADEKVSEQKLSAVFTDSGFSISNLTVSNLTVSNLTVNQQADIPVRQSQQASLELQLEVNKIDQLSAVIEAVGNIAASTPSRLLIHAPPAQEDAILKPLLMGRQQVIKVRYVTIESDTVQLQLFENKTR